MNMPSHHQSPFYQAIRDSGIDLVVHYYGAVDATRIAMGWDNVTKLPAGEAFVNPSIDSLTQCADWRDRVHIVPGYGTPFTRKLATYLSAQKVSWVHWSEPAQTGLRWWLSYPRKRWYARLVNDSALGAFAIGDLAVRDFQNWGIRRSKIVLLPYASEGIDQVDKRDPAIGAFAKEGELVFLYLGSLCHRKGIDVLLQALKELGPSSAPYCLVLVGKDLADGRYQGMAARLGISQKVLFRGAVPVSNIGAALRCANVLVLPSRFDGWGMVLSEAASLGKALIATEACGAAYHLIVQGENGFRVPPGDAVALAQAMRAYVTDPTLSRLHGDRSRAIVVDYSPSRNVERLIEGINEFEAGSPHRQHSGAIPCA
jgi:glycosyltransferase involved in cell wall biosynthesis